MVRDFDAVVVSAQCMLQCFVTLELMDCFSDCSTVPFSWHFQFIKGFFLFLPQPLSTASGPMGCGRLKGSGLLDTSTAEPGAPHGRTCELQ